MIDIESKVITKVHDDVIKAYPNAYITSEYSRTSSQFPCVQVVEMDNAVLTNAGTLNKIEVMARLVYEINIYSNNENGKKSECRSIASIVDNAMEDLGFRRTSLNQIPNYEDSTIYRMVGRWEIIEVKQ